MVTITSTDNKFLEGSASRAVSVLIFNRIRTVYDTSFTDHGDYTKFTVIL